jgi:hypothetical protein
LLAKEESLRNLETRLAAQGPQGEFRDWYLLIGCNVAHWGQVVYPLP